MQLYHGSKSGLSGIIQPISREQCDFGRGFYMGTDQSQPLTLICNHEKPKIYRVEFDLTGLNVLELKADIDWAMLIAYYRGVMDDVHNTKIYAKYEKMANAGYDVIVGLIANDKMYSVIERFFDRSLLASITDVQLVQCLSALNLGTQYVAKTQKACDQIKIISEHELSTEERRKLITLSARMRNQGIALATNIVQKNRRAEGRYFDEILGGEE